jgi:hypothetical protein
MNGAGGRGFLLRRALAAVVTIGLAGISVLSLRARPEPVVNANHAPSDPDENQSSTNAGLASRSDGTGGIASAVHGAHGSGSAAFIGSGSCNSGGCHGSMKPEPSGRILGNEYRTWADTDPHAGAGVVLLAKRSKVMLDYLAALPHRDPKADRKACVTCHAPGAEPANFESLTRPAGLADGVRCEDCHGSAARWLEPHKSGPLGPARKAELGMTDTDSFVGRAKACAGCHVGSPGAEVDHDLIAGGHPRLNAELLSQLDRYPAHWDQRKERAARGTDAALKLWLAGQVTATERVGELIVARSRSTAVWPDLAWSNCYSCHRPVPFPEPVTLDGPGRPAIPGLGDWYLHDLAGLMGSDAWPLDPARRAEWSTSIAGLQSAGRSLTPTRPGLTGPAERLRSAARNLLPTGADGESGSAARPVMTPAALRKLADELTASLSSRPPLDWENATQRWYLARALAESLRAAGDGPAADQLLASFAPLKAKLRFPAGQASPKSFRPIR